MIYVFQFHDYSFLYLSEGDDKTDLGFRCRTLPECRVRVRSIAKSHMVSIASVVVERTIPVVSIQGRAAFDCFSRKDCQIFQLGMRRKIPARSVGYRIVLVLSAGGFGRRHRAFRSVRLSQEVFRLEITYV